MAKKEAKKKNETSEGDDSVEEIEETVDSEEANSGVSETEEIENPEEVKDNDVEIEEDENPKGRLKVSQRERDEIDAVIDAFWGFVGAVKEAPRIILLLGLFLALMGATFAGWPQSFFGVEVEDKTGVWVLISDSNYELSKDQDGFYPAYNTGDSVWVQGNLQEIQYYGPIEERLYPILGTGLENPSVAPGDGFRIVQNAELDELFSSSDNSSGINYVNGENIEQSKNPDKKQYADFALDSALFADITFKDVIFSNVIFNDTFFVDCTFERVSFYNVHLNRSVFSNNKFETVVFNNVTVQSSKVENSNFLHFWVKDSKFNGTDFDRSYINGSKWSYSSLQNGTFQRGEINVVIFRSFEVNNFELVLSDVKNILDAPKTATFDFTYIIVGETEIKVNGNIIDDYPLGQSLIVSTTVKKDGENTGRPEGNGSWFNGDIFGEGFSKSTGESKENLSYEYMVAENPTGILGFLIHDVLRMKDGGIDATFKYTIFFNMVSIIGLIILVYAIGTISAILSLLKIISPFLMTVSYFLLLSLILTEKGFFNMTSLMLLYFVPPLGKESVIPLGIAQGLHWTILAFSIAFVDIVVCLFLIWNFDLAKKFPFIGSGIRRMQAKGKSILESMPWVERLTFFGIVVFVMIPFQGSGAFAGTILGRSVGLSTISNIIAVGAGALIGSVIIALSIMYGLGFLSYLGPIQLAAFIILIMIGLTILVIYRHWDELSMDEFTQTLGLHRDGVIGAPLTAAGELMGTAGGSVMKAAGDTGKSVMGVAGNTGKIITKRTGELVGSLVGSFTDDKYDYIDTSDPMELDSGVLVPVAASTKRRRIVVTGGAGFIGSHLVDRLVKREEDVIVLDNFSSGDLEFLYDSIEDITLVDIDLLTGNFDEYLKDVKIVYHLAANPEVQVGITKPEVMQEQNVDVTQKVLDAMKRTGCDRIVFTSTSAVYGDAEVIPTPEDTNLKPISAYGSSKSDAEKLIEKYCDEYQFRGVSYRFANCVGPRSNHGVTFDFVNKLRDNPKELEILGDGEQHKSYFHVDDCVSAMLAKTPGELCTKGEFVALNVGSKDAIDVKTLANEVCKTMKLKDVDYKFTGGVDGGRGWKGDVKKMRLDIKRMKSHGWNPQYTSRKAIGDTAKWLDENS